MNTLPPAYNVTVTRPLTAKWRGYTKWLDDGRS